MYKKIHEQDASRPQDFDQDLFMKEKSASRASFIMGVAGIEAFTNNVLRDFSVRTKDDLPKNLLNKKQIENPINYWRLVDKVYFLPTLCNPQLEPPPFYFQENSKEFKLFKELVEIRNSIMHGRPEPFLVLVKLKPDRFHELTADFPDNLWPISRVPKDFSSFNYECAKTAYENIIWVRDSLVTFLEKVDEKYMMEEKIELISPVINDNNVSKEELLKNSGKYINTTIK
ncbi:MAG: hypothetical protein MUP17_01050 [candidate division Zixibacteria bacterium]|nr:hypothetical protein [candidate division Zixibacteria bacterium]